MNYCLTVTRTTETLESLPEDPSCQYPEGWDNDVLSIEKIWFVKPNSLEWSKGETTCRHEGPNSAGYAIPEDEADAVLDIYQADWSYAVACWLVDDAGIQRVVTSMDDLCFVPMEVEEALGYVEYPGEIETMLRSRVAELNASEEMAAV